jgi:hypothetical protein
MACNQDQTLIIMISITFGKNHSGRCLRESGKHVKRTKEGKLPAA